MVDINGISNVDNKNNYSINAGKKTTGSGADFSSFLGETKSLDQIFEKAAQKYNVPENLLKAVGKAESNFKANAVSRCGAQGIMQLMPATAKELGVTDSFNAEQNIMGGAKYISGLMKKYDGDTRLALAAYNAGSGNVAKYGGIPPFAETQNYVKKVMNFVGQDMDTEVASANINNMKNVDTSISKAASVPTATPIQKNLSFLMTSETATTPTEMLDLDSLFSYDDYLKFMDIFLAEEKEKDLEENKSGFSSKDINYNVPVMNLLMDQKLV